MRDSILSISKARFGVSFMAFGTIMALTACSQSPDTTASAPTTPPTANQSLAAFRSYDQAGTASTSNSQCSLDQINSQPIGAINHLAWATLTVPVTFAGWIGNGQGQIPAKPILVLKSDKQSYSTPIATGFVRADVAAALKSSGLTNAGFNLLVSLGDVKPGAYALQLADAAYPYAICDVRKQLVISE